MHRHFIEGPSPTPLPPVLAAPSTTGGRLLSDLIVAIAKFHLGAYGTEAETFFESYTNAYTLTARRHWPRQVRIHALSHVNRCWHNALVHVLYRHPVLLTAHALGQFAALVRARPGLLTYVRQLTMIDRTQDAGGEDWLPETGKPAHEELEELLAACEPGAL